MTTLILEFLIDRMLTIAEVKQFLEEVMPGYQACSVESSNWENDCLTFSVHESEDQEQWICLLDVLTFPELSKFGEFPEIALAMELHIYFGVNAVIGTSSLIDGLDNSDPDWRLAFIEGKWFFASSGNSRFMIGEKALSPKKEEQPKLLARLNFDEPRKHLFHYKDLVKSQKL